MQRILYFCPDFPQPSGGTKTLYRHVQHLRALGFDAFIVHQKRGFTLTWHSYSAPVLWLEDKPQFHSADLLVFPEVMVDFVRQTQHFAGQRIVLALSWAPTYHRLKPGERWQDYGVTQVLTKSPLIQRYLQWSMGVEVSLIHENVDATRYRYAAPAKKNQVAYLTRKDASGDWLQGVLKRKHATLGTYTWLPLREMSEEVYAQHLRESQLYLATTLQEGMHVSVLEAMACGCVVVGYAGIGGNDYMVGSGERQNCLLVENGHLPALGEMVEQVLFNLLADPHRYDAVIEQALATARPYQDPTLEAQSLRAFFEKFA